MQTLLSSSSVSIQTSQGRILYNCRVKCHYPMTINLGESIFPTPLKQIPVMGDDLTFDNLEITFLVDEKHRKLYRITQLVSWYWFSLLPVKNTIYKFFRTDNSDAFPTNHWNNWFCDIAWNCNRMHSQQTPQQLQCCVW